MLGALLGALQLITPLNYPDVVPMENEADDTHWADDKDRFKDWLLNGEATEADQPDEDFYY